jgi:hypothetical protein
MVLTKEMLYYSCFFNFALEYAIRNQEDHKGFELNGTHQVLISADDDNLFCKDINTIKNVLNECSYTCVGTYIIS